ncbi:hypothetical protein FHU40_005434 [Nocardioides soli]|uniref:Uncharacterized protein n=1 Tax=Nocardioides soli TaxID=1036020 RepID=A0A7W4Z3K4_9ACTN|nr:hypothetical protein [Nocardioides soli]
MRSPPPILPPQLFQWTVLVFVLLHFFLVV